LSLAAVLFFVFFASSKDMVRYGLRFAGRAVIHGLSALDVDISQANIR